jgi:hypothetical protein
MTRHEVGPGAAGLPAFRGLKSTSSPTAHGRYTALQAALLIDLPLYPTPDPVPRDCIPLLRTWRSDNLNWTEPQHFQRATAPRPEEQIKSNAPVGETRVALLTHDR